MLGGVDPIDPSVTEALDSLRTQLQAGVSLPRSLRGCAGVCRHPTARRLFERAADRVDRGAGFDQMLETLADAFSYAERAILVAGWEAGQVDGAVESVVQRRRILLEARRRIRSGLILPAVVLTAACFIAPFPAFFMGELGLGGYLLTALGPLVLAAACFLAVRSAQRKRTRQWASMPAGAPAPPSDAFDRWLLAFPVFGAVERWRNLSEFATLLGYLLEAGLGYTAALDAVARALPNGLFREDARLLRDRIESGIPPAEALPHDRRWPADWRDMLRIAHEAGREPEMLRRIGSQARERYVRNVEQAARWIPRIIYVLVCLYVIYHIFKIVRTLPQFGGPMP